MASLTPNNVDNPLDITHLLLMLQVFFSAASALPMKQVNCIIYVCQSEVMFGHGVAACTCCLSALPQRFGVILVQLQHIL